MRFVFLLLAVLVASTCLVRAQDCSTLSCLRRIYNSRVTRAQIYTRPLSSGRCDSGSRRKRGSRGPMGSGYSYSHSGIVMTVSNGDRWLIHRGSDYGESSSTVITNADYMSSRWTAGPEGTPCYGTTVGDFMSHAYADDSYSLTSRNCHHATNSMWNNLVAPCD